MQIRVLNQSKNFVLNTVILPEENFKYQAGYIWIIMDLSAPSIVRLYRRYFV